MHCGLLSRPSIFTSNVSYVFSLWVWSTPRCTFLLYGFVGPGTASTGDIWGRSGNSQGFTSISKIPVRLCGAVRYPMRWHGEPLPIQAWSVFTTITTAADAQWVVRKVYPCFSFSVCLFFPFSSRSFTLTGHHHKRAHQYHPAVPLPAFHMDVLLQRW